MKDDQGQNHYAVEPFELPGDGLCDHSGEALLQDCCRELGVTQAMAEQIVAWAEETMGTARGETPELGAAKAMDARFRQALHVLITYQANQKSAADVQMSTRVLALELGYTTAAGAECVADLARRLGLQKQTVNKCALNFQSKLGLPPRLGQRGELARANMAEARKGQLETTVPVEATV